jgi:hypothetical protein
MATLVSGIKMSMPKLIGSPGDRRRDMRRSGLCLYFHYAVSALVLIGLSRTATSAKPLALHPKNPHYFLFRGKPAILVTSQEHYGAVLNLDFDYRKYLATLAGDGLNLTRTFTGAYVEPVGAFKIERNTGSIACAFSLDELVSFGAVLDKFDVNISHYRAVFAIARQFDSDLCMTRTGVLWDPHGAVIQHPSAALFQLMFHCYFPTLLVRAKQDSKDGHILT